MGNCRLHSHSNISFLVNEFFGLPSQLLFKTPSELY